jgi:hypothetical protein
MGQLSVAEADHVTPRAKRPGLLVHPGISGQLRHHGRRNIIADLTENGECRRGWKFGAFQDLSCDS